VFFIPPSLIIMKFFTKTIIFLTFALSTFFMVTPVFAANLFFEAGNHTFAQGQEFLVTVFLNSQGESINAVEGSLVFPEALLEAKEIRDGSSILNFWITRPNINQLGVINFSGIIPGGYGQPKGLLFSVVFKTKIKGNGQITIDEPRVLKDDGKGTSASVSVSPFAFSVFEDGIETAPKVEAVKDSEAPEIFTPEVASSQDLFGGKWFLVFATQDKGSGIDHYEVSEGSPNQFVVAQSPYLLGDQTLRKEIFVKAVDKNGNERTVKVEPKNKLTWYEYYIIWGIIILIFIFIIHKLWKRKKRRF